MLLGPLFDGQHLLYFYLLQGISQEFELRSTYHILICITSLSKSEDLVVHDRVNVVGFNGPNHISHQLLAANIDTTDSADVAQSIQDARLLIRVETTQEANHTDDTLELDSLEALLQSASSTDFNNVIHTCTFGGQLASRLAPVRVSLIVDDMIGAQLFKLRGLLVRRCRSDYGRSRGLCKLCPQILISQCFNYTQRNEDHLPVN